MPRGGARPGAGRKSNAERAARAERLQAEASAAARASAEKMTKAQSEPKKAVEILSEGANFFYALAAFYQPVPTNVNADDKKFRTYMAEARSFATRLIGFETPSLASIRQVNVPMDLSGLTDEELAELERLHAKAANIGGDQGGDRPPLN